MLKSLNKRSVWRTYRAVLPAGVLTLAIEALTLLGRFALGLQAANPHAVVKACTFGLRIHHGYIGVICLLAAICLRKRLALRDIALAAGAALVLSDLAHHFLVLWPITGHHEFYFVYPKLD